MQLKNDLKEKIKEEEWYYDETKKNVPSSKTNDGITTVGSGDDFSKKDSIQKNVSKNKRRLLTFKFPKIADLGIARRFGLKSKLKSK